MPPASTGIASYDQAVMDDLRRTGFLHRYRTDVIWPVRSSQDRRIAAYDLGIFQLGNNARFHGQIYRLAIASPGLVVLHDLASTGSSSVLAAEGDPAAIAAARPPPSDRGSPDPDMAMHEPLRSVWCAAVARASRGIVVHPAREALPRVRASARRSSWCRIRWSRTSARCGAPSRARTSCVRCSRRGARTIVVAPGDVNEAKCLPALVEAIAALPEDVHGVLVGRRIPGTDIAERPDPTASGIGSPCTTTSPTTTSGPGWWRPISR